MDSLQAWQLLKHTNTISNSNSIEEFMNTSQCTSLPIANKQNYYAIEMSKSGYGNPSMKLTIFWDKINELIWIIKCVVLNKTSD